MTIETFMVGVSYDANMDLAAIDEKIADGYEVLNVSIVNYDGEVSERWTLRKGENAVTQNAVSPANIQVRAIVSIECRETYSKTTQRYFKFWTCVLDNGEKVNIFDHPDEKRNTFKICMERGWASLHSFDIGEIETYDTPIPVVVSYDGEWYSLVDIINDDKWLDLAWHYTEPDTSEDTEQDMPSEPDNWYHESADDSESVRSLRKAIDDIRNASFDDDSEDETSGESDES